MIDFAKRLLKFAVKHSVGKYLASEPDLRQLDVDLGSGCVELKDALLNCEALNKDLVRWIATRARRLWWCMLLGFCVGAREQSCHLTAFSANQVNHYPI
jgi:hypothetical protein